MDNVLPGVILSSLIHPLHRELHGHRVTSQDIWKKSCYRHSGRLGLVLVNQSNWLKHPDPKDPGKKTQKRQWHKDIEKIMTQRHSKDNDTKTQKRQWLQLMHTMTTQLLINKHNMNSQNLLYCWTCTANLCTTITNSLSHSWSYKQTNSFLRFSFISFTFYSNYQ